MKQRVTVKYRQVNMEDEEDLGGDEGFQADDDDEEVRVIRSTFNQEKTEYIANFAEAYYVNNATYDTFAEALAKEDYAKQLVSELWNEFEDFHDDTALVILASSRWQPDQTLTNGNAPYALIEFDVFISRGMIQGRYPSGRLRLEEDGHSDDEPDVRLFFKKYRLFVSEQRHPVFKWSPELHQVYPSIGIEEVDA